MMDIADKLKSLFYMAYSLLVIHLLIQNQNSKAYLVVGAFNDLKLLRNKTSLNYFVVLPDKLINNNFEYRDQLKQFLSDYRQIRFAIVMKQQKLKDSRGLFIYEEINKLRLFQGLEVLTDYIDLLLVNSSGGVNLQNCLKKLLLFQMNKPQAYNQFKGISKLFLDLLFYNNVYDLKRLDVFLPLKNTQFLDSRYLNFNISEKIDLQRQISKETALLVDHIGAALLQKSRPQLLVLLPNIYSQLDLNQITTFSEIFLTDVTFISKINILNRFPNLSMKLVGQIKRKIIQTYVRILIQNQLNTSQIADETKIELIKKALRNKRTNCYQTLQQAECNRQLMIKAITKQLTNSDYVTIFDNLLQKTQQQN